MSRRLDVQVQDLDSVTTLLRSTFEHLWSAELSWRVALERVTMDVDIAVQMNKNNLGRFVSVMQALNLQPRVPVLKHVDVFLTQDHSYESLVSDCERLSLRDQTIQIASIETLIRLKKLVDPPWAKDIHDIAELSAKLWVVASNNKHEDPISAFREEDFRGRTEFASLTPEQKLEWLAHASAFVFEARKARKSSNTTTKSKSRTPY